MEPSMGPTYADILPGCLIGIAVGVDTNGDGHALPVYSVCAPSSVLVHPHYHRFKNIPLKLFRDEITLERTYGSVTETKDIKPHDAIRAVGSRNNSINPILAKPVQNSKSNNTVLEKFGGSVCDDLVIDNGGRSVTLADEPVEFTSAEYDLLWLLASNAGRILSREDIFERLRGIEYDGQDRSIDVRISRIRPKIGDDPDNPKRIKTVRSKGYLFVKESLGG